MENSNTNSKREPDDRSSGVLVNINNSNNSNNSNFLLIGGGNREKTFNDFWLLKVNKSNQADKFEISWKEIQPNCSSFVPRFGMSGCVGKKEDLTEIWIHGGQNYFENKHFADMIELKLKFKNESLEVLKLNNTTTYPLDISKYPRERNSHCLVGIKEEEQASSFYIFGGGSNEGLLNDLWKFDSIEQKWSKCSLKGEEIVPREMHGGIIYTNKNKETYLYIFGGRLYESIDNKVYRVNLSDYASELVTSMPLPLCSFSYVGYKHFLIIYGGTDGNTFLNDIIILNLITLKWAKSKFQINSDFINNDPNLSAFIGRIGSLMSIDEKEELLVIFGGSSLHKDTNYTSVISLKHLFDENNLTPYV